ncbi:MAG: PspC domain-containing protein [Muribaculaceae bacterium]|nr:PspC domain-containing protein [Muribaculaceae bacterium]
MKKTFNINLAGFPFTIDEDAYNLLKDYLDTIRFAFETNDDTEDLANDIEGRIAEILIEKEQGGLRIITLSEISQVIERIGQPADFIDVEIQTNDGDSSREANKPDCQQINPQSVTPPPYNPGQYRNTIVRKRLFRDPQNSMLGGVCAGLASYLNMETWVVRLIAVCLLFLSGTTVAIVYIILWIVLPPANTPLQKLQMKGEDPTMENIGKTVTETFRSEDTNGNISNPEKKSFLENALSVFVKCLIILGMIIAIPLLIVLGATLIGCMIAVFVIGIGIFSGGMFDSFTEGLMVLFILLAVIGGAITLGVPLWLLIRKLTKKNEEPVSTSTQRSILIIWLIGIAMTAVFTTKAVKTGMKLDREHWGMKIENLSDINSVYDLEDFIDPDEIKNLSIINGKITLKTYDGKTVVIEDGSVKLYKDDENVEDAVEDSLSLKETLTTTEENLTTTSDTIKIQQTNSVKE